MMRIYLSAKRILNKFEEFNIEASKMNNWICTIITTNQQTRSDSLFVSIFIVTEKYLFKTG